MSVDAIGRAWTTSLVALMASALAMPLAAQTTGASVAPSPPAPAPKPAPAKAARAKAARPKPPPASDSDDEATTLSGFTVTGKKPLYSQLPGAVVGDIEPELELSPSDVQSYGVSTVTDLLNELTPETRSDRGRGGETPVVLLNGRRISSLNEIMNIPTEAILRVDILPEEVSLKYGYTADQRVVNIVLRRRFHATTAELQGGGPTEGGEETGQAELDKLTIRRDDRLNLDLKYQGASGITDAARDIVEPAPISGGANPAGLANDRSLSPATQTLTANAVLAHPIGAGINATFNATLTANSSNALQGLPGQGTPGQGVTNPAPSEIGPAVVTDNPLHQYVNGWTGHLGSTFNKDVGDWRLSLTNAYDHADTQTDTDKGFSLPQATARSISDSANIQILANGPLVKVPAGNFYVSAKAGDTQSWLGSTSTRGGEFQSVYLTRNDGNAQLNVDLPLTSRRKNFLPFMGELSINANAAVDQLSDFGTLKAFGYGVNWTPIVGYNLIISHTNDQVAPTIQQLGNPMIETPGVRVFDYLTGQTVDVTQITGGNPGLVHDNRNVTKVGLTLKPFPAREFTFTANYIKSDIDNAIETFPAASAAIQLAFPDRFVRDDDGDLILEDIRAVNFAKADRSELRWGINYSRPIGKQPPPRRPFLGANGLPRRPRGNASSGLGVGADGAPPGAPPGGDAGGNATGGGSDRASGGGGGDRANGPGGGGGGGGRGGGGGGRFGGGGGPPTGGRLQVAVYHTLYFSDRMLVRPGGPTLDLLGGAPATGTGGQYRNEIEGQLGITDAGFGARLSADWREATFVQGAVGSPTGNLYFSGITTLNFRLWDTLGQQKAVVKALPWLRGARISLYVSNLLDERIQVRDAAGGTPLSYQPGYLDPVGRAVTLSVRKLFY